MQSIRDITLEWVVLHTADSSLESPSLSDDPIALDDDLRQYFEDHIKSCLKASQAMMGKFIVPGDTVAASTFRMIDEGPSCCQDVSVAVAWWLHQQIARLNAMTADIAICTFIDLDTGDRYVAILKLDPMRVYLKADEATKFNQLLVLPDAAHGLKTWAIIRTFDAEARYDLLFRAHKEDDYWAPEFLQCNEISTPRQMTKLVLNETSKWLDANTDMVSPEVATELSKTVLETAKSTMMDLEELAERVIPNSEMRDDYIGRMLDKGLTETTFVPDRDYAERQARKTTYVLDDGVYVSGPADAIDDVVQILPKTEDGKTRLVIESKKFYQK